MYDTIRTIRIHSDKWFDEVMMFSQSQKKYDKYRIIQGHKIMSDFDKQIERLFSEDKNQIR